MTDLREAAQQALEAWDNDENGTLDHPLSCSMEAIRAALEQSEQEPVLTVNKMGSLVECSPTIAAFALPDGEFSLYTQPPSRQWRGLSKDEALKLWGMRSDGPSNTEITSYARTIEAKLKELNHD